LFSLRIYSTDKVEQDLSFSGGAAGVMSVDYSQDQYEALIQVQRQVFIKVVLAILGVAFCWKNSISMGCKIWGGGALVVALLVFFPTVFDWRSYRLTKNLTSSLVYVYTKLAPSVSTSLANCTRLRKLKVRPVKSEPSSLPLKLVTVSRAVW
jgi:hypothetical protein